MSSDSGFSTKKGSPAAITADFDVAMGEGRYADKDGVEAFQGDEIGVGLVSSRAKPTGKFGCTPEIGIGIADDRDVLHTGQHSDMPLGDASGTDETYSEPCLLHVHATHILSVSFGRATPFLGPCAPR